MEASSKPSIGTSPAVQWLGRCASTTGGIGLTPDQGTRMPHATEQLSLCTTTTESACSGACMPQLESPCATTKDRHDTTKTRHSQVSIS